MKKLLSILTIILACGVLSACGSTSESNPTQISIIENVEQFSRISKKELKNIMGKPTTKETWTNKTSKGNFKVATWSYDKNSNHYEFIIADDSVIRLSIYSNNYWNGKGDRFAIDDTKERICESFGITLGDNVKSLTNNNSTYTLSPVNEKVAMFDVQDIDSNTYGFVKITYNLNYFD